MAAEDIIEQIKKWQDLIKEIPKPKITQIRINNHLPSDKAIMVGKHLYISDAGLQAMGAEKGSSNDIGGLFGVPILREYPPDDICLNCGGTEFEVRDYSPIWHDGNLCCKNCGRKLRNWDAG